MDLLNWPTASSSETTTPEPDREKEEALKNPEVSLPLRPHATPMEIAEVDRKHEDVVQQMGGRVLTVIRLTGQMVAAAWALSEYVPEGAAEKGLWRDNILPKLCGALVDDIKARNLLEKSLTDILCLAQVVKECGANLKARPDSKRAIEIARTQIPEALQVLDEDIKILSSVSNRAIELFEVHIRDLLEIVGAQAANFAKEEEDFREEIKKLQEPIDELHEQLAETKGAIKKYHSLIGAMEHALNLTGKDIEEAKQRTEELLSQIKVCDNRINNIPQVQVVERSSSCFFGLIRSHSRLQVPNPDRDAQKAYWDSIIAARNARLLEEAKLKGQIAMVRERQEADLAGYKDQLAKSKAEYATLTEKLEALSNTNVPLINGIIKKIQDLHATADKVILEVGMSGSALIDCLNAIREFAKAKQEGTCLFEPLISVLKYVKSMTNASVALLAEGDHEDLIIGGRRLLEKVGFIENTSLLLTTKIAADAEEKRRNAAIKGATEKKFITL